MSHNMVIKCHISVNLIKIHHLPQWLFDPRWWWYIDNDDDDDDDDDDNNNGDDDEHDGDDDEHDDDDDEHDDNNDDLVRFSHNYWDRPQHRISIFNLMAQHNIRASTINIYGIFIIQVLSIRLKGAINNSTRQ